MGINMLSILPFIVNRTVFVRKPSKDTRTLVVYNGRVSKVKAGASENTKNISEEESFIKNTPIEGSDVYSEDAKQKEIRMNIDIQRKFKAEKRKEAWEESKLKKKV